MTRTSATSSTARLLRANRNPGSGTGTAQSLHVRSGGPSGHLPFNWPVSRETSPHHGSESIFRSRWARVCAACRHKKAPNSLTVSWALTCEDSYSSSEPPSSPRSNRILFQILAICELNRKLSLALAHDDVHPSIKTISRATVRALQALGRVRVFHVKQRNDRHG